MHIDIIISISLLVWAFIIWKKNNDKRYFWYLFPIAGLLILSGTQYLLDKYFLLAGNQGVIQFFIFTFLRIIAGIALLLITLKTTFK